MNNLLRKPGSFCIVLNIITISTLFVVLFYIFKKDETNFYSSKNIDRCDSLYCFPGMRGGVNVPGDVIIGEMIEIKPFIEPWFLTKYDEKQIIPIYYLFKYVSQDSSFKCIDSIEYANNNSFHYLIKDDYTNLLGVAFLADNKPVSFTLILSPHESQISEKKLEEVKNTYNRFQSYIKRVGKNFDKYKL